MASPANQSLSSSTSAASSTIGLSPPRCVGPHCLKIIYHSLHLPSFLPHVGLRRRSGQWRRGRRGRGPLDHSLATCSPLGRLFVLGLVHLVAHPHSLARSLTNSLLPSVLRPSTSANLAGGGTIKVAGGGSTRGFGVKKERPSDRGLSWKPGGWLGRLVGREVGRLPHCL